MKHTSRLMTPPITHAGEPFLNRELSLLAFNERVLAMAEDAAIPALERLRYVCIVSNNLDELFEIRVAGIKAQLRSHPDQIHDDGHSAASTYRAVCERAHQLVERQYALLNQQIIPLLQQHGIHFHTAGDLNDAQRRWAYRYFSQEVLPVLTPIGLSPTHPFPRVLNKSLNFIMELEGEDSFGRDSGVAVVQAPRALPRLVAMPQQISGFEHGFMMLSSFVQCFIHDLFPGMTVNGVHPFRVTRNSDLYVDDEEVTDLREALQIELSQRQFGDAVRLEVSEGIPENLRQLLRDEFGLTDGDCYRVHGPVNMVRLMQLPDLVDKPKLKFPGFSPRYPSALDRADLFAVLRQRDVLVHHPYDAFASVSDFIRKAATDPHVVAIKQTIYRTGQTSDLMESLLTAARAGKEVTVVVELMARFDEETNINWASRLEDAGAHVVFGVVGNKTHAKMCLIVRKEPEGLTRYAHLGTGNYHPRTAKLYTDFGLFTAHADMCADVHEVFQQLTGLGQAKALSVLWQSPFTLHQRTLTAIAREAEHARAARPARIIAKMNSLVERDVIRALYAASQAGVKIDLIVRGVCMLRPGVPGLSPTIRVRSTIGRFLEHSRIFYFRNDGQEDVLLSSADWMDRNFFRRVELAFPVLDKKLKRRVIREGLTLHLRDNALAWNMQPDGSYTIRRIKGEKRRASQEILLAECSVLP